MILLLTENKKLKMFEFKITLILSSESSILTVLCVNVFLFRIKSNYKTQKPDGLLFLLAYFWIPLLKFQWNAPQQKIN